MLQKFDCYDGLCFCGGLVFFAPVALLVRTQAGVSESLFFVLQALISMTVFLGEVPTGMLADRLGYKRTLVLAQLAALLAKILLLAAFLLSSPALFAVQAMAEGLSICFFSGTADAYVYEVYGAEHYLQKSAQAANYQTAGFLLSTLSFVALYQFFGIPGLLIATVVTYALCVGFSLGLKKEEHCLSEAPAQPAPARLFTILKQGKAVGLMLLSAVFTICAILINFFYAGKLLECGISAGWMSPIILSYSLLKMLGRPILDRLKNVPRWKSLGFSCVLAAGALMVFSRVNRALPVVGLMLILPLLLSIPEFFLGEQKNAFIDSLGLGENRAANLSVMNMGGSVAEILALFASALLTGAGVGVCFLAAGGVLLMFGLLFLLKQ